MDRQEVYNKVKTHLLTQKRQAVQGTTCVYRTSSGLKCAVGCLIPDEVYTTDFESKDVVNLLIKFPNLKTILGVETYGDIQFLARLQNIHDNYILQEWTQKLNAFAHDQGLVP